MRITDHSIIANIRSQLLVRISFVLEKLSAQNTNIAMASYLNCSSGTISKLRNYNLGDRTQPLRNLDRILRVCELLRIDYTITVKTVRGVPYHTFDAPSSSTWSLKDHKLPIHAPQLKGSI